MATMPRDDMRSDRGLLRDDLKKDKIMSYLGLKSPLEYQKLGVEVAERMKACGILINSNWRGGRPLDKIEQIIEGVLQKPSLPPAANLPLDASKAAVNSLIRYIRAKVRIKESQKPKKSSQQSTSLLQNVISGAVTKPVIAKPKRIRSSQAKIPLKPVPIPVTSLPPTMTNTASTMAPGENSALMDVMLSAASAPPLPNQQQSAQQVSSSIQRLPPVSQPTELNSIDSQDGHGPITKSITPQSIVNADMAAHPVSIAPPIPMRTYPSYQKVSQSPPIALDTLPLPDLMVVDEEVSVQDSLSPILSTRTYAQVCETSPSTTVFPEMFAIPANKGIGPEPRPLKDYPIMITGVIANASVPIAFMTVGDTLPQDTSPAIQGFDLADLATLRQVMYDQVSERRKELLMYRQGDEVVFICNSVLLRYFLKAAFYGGQDLLRLQLGPGV